MPRNPRPRILIVEDEALLAIDLAEALDRSGYEPVGPFADVTAAAVRAESEPLDAAVLDINVRGRSIYTVADALARRSIPFLFASGNVRQLNLPERFADRPYVAKPYEADEVAATLAALVA